MDSETFFINWEDDIEEMPSEENVRIVNYF